MPRRLRPRLTYANIVSTVCLFVLLGGSATAAVVLAKNSVKNKHIAKNAVTTQKVKNGSLLKADFKAGQLPQGPQGSQGPTGAPGSAAAFARVASNGALQPDVAGFPSQVKGVDAGDVVKGDGAAATGTYCFGGLDFRPASALVALDNADTAAADRNLVTSVAIDRGEDLGDCPATHNQARVRIVDGNTAAAQDARFFIWFER